MTEPLILCAVADDDHAADVVATGRALADAGGCRLLFLHVSEPIVPPHAAMLHPGAASAAAATYDRQTLQDAALENASRVFAQAGVWSEDEVLVASGAAAGQVRRVADEQDAVLVVLGSRRKGAVLGALAGSVSRALARDCPRPVLIAQRDQLPGDGPVLCGVQCDDDASRGAVRAAGRLAATFGRRLVVAHVALPESGRWAPVEEGQAMVRSILEAAGIDEAEIAVVGGTVTWELERLAARLEASLLVVGSHGTGAVQAAVAGTVSLDLTREADRPLVIVPETAA